MEVQGSIRDIENKMKGAVMITAKVVMTLSEKAKEGVIVRSFQKHCEFQALPRIGEAVVAHERPFTVYEVSHTASPGSGVVVAIRRSTVDSGYFERILAGGWEAV